MQSNNIRTKVADSNEELPYCKQKKMKSEKQEINATFVANSLLM